MNRRLFHTRSYATPNNYSAESLALFAAMVTPLSTHQKNVVDYVVNLWVTNNVFSEADRIWVPCLMTEQQSLLNWKNPGGAALVPNNFASTFIPKIGYPGNPGASAYLTTDYNTFVNGVNWTLNDCKVIARTLTNIQDDGWTLGARANGNTVFRQRDTANTFIGRVNGGFTSTAGMTNGSGVFSVGTSDGLNIVKKRDNIVVGTDVVSTVSVTNQIQLIYCWNDTGDIPANFCSNTIQCVIYGSSAIDDGIVKTGMDYLLANL